jgi:DNA-binding IclR family transcriptional regulator
VVRLLKKYSVPALEKAMVILDLLADSDKGYTITELNVQSKIPKATVFTTLSVLEDHNMVKKDDNGKYRIGAKVYTLGMKYARQNSILEVSRRHLAKLMNETGFTVHLGVLDDGKVLYIDKLEPDSYIKFSSYPGMRSDFHITGLGKAIAAFLSNDDFDKLITRASLYQHTPKTITQIEDLQKILEKVRINGYSVEDEEEEMGVCCIGAPIFGEKGKLAIAAVSVTALTTQITPDKYHEIGEKVRSIALTISRELGYSE